MNEEKVHVWATHPPLGLEGDPNPNMGMVKLTYHAGGDGLEEVKSTMVKYAAQARYSPHEALI